MSKIVGANLALERSALHCHSEYSNTKNLDCIIKLKDLIFQSQAMGFKAVAITDHSCLSGHIKALNYQDEINKIDPEFKVILGDEIYLINERETEYAQKYYHFILLAKDEIGHRYLRELSTLAWKNSWWEKGQRRTPVLYSEIENIVVEQGHLIASTACLGGMLSTAILKYSQTNAMEDKQHIVDFIEWCLKIFGEDFYIELQSGTTPEQIIVNQKALQIAKCFNIKCILTDDAHYLNKEDRGLHEAFLNSRKADDSVREVGDFYEATYLKSDEDILDRLDYLDFDTISELCKNTMEIADKCQKYSLKQNTIVPQRPLPDFAVQHLFKDWYDKCEFIKKYAYSDYKQDLFLLSEIEKGFVEREQEFNETNLLRLNEELETLWVVSDRLKQRLSAYYNLVDYLIDLIWHNAESIVGISRGSVGGSYFAYLTGICQMNPLTYNLPWWRHLHESRPELPDVDFDSESMKRDSIIEMIRQEFTEDRVLNIITFKTETSKSSVLTACRGLGIPLEEAQQLADLIPIIRGKAYTIRECLEGDEENGKEPVTLFKKTINEYDGLLDIVLKIEGLISGVSSHASGLYLFNDNYIEQNSLMKTPKGLPITCWEMSDSDQVGALKVDLLTVENLDAIHETLNLLINNSEITKEDSFRNTYNKFIHPDVLDYNTPEMFNLLGTEQGNNIFQLSTDMGMKACQMIKPKSVNQMGLVNSLMRLMSDGGETPLEKYQRFSKNIQEWYKEMEDCGLNAEEVAVLEKYLLPNNGICAEQEDLMAISMCDKISGFSMKEANGLRKAVAKKKAALIQASKDLFYAKGKELGTRQEMLDYVWNKQFSLSLGLNDRSSKI